MGCIWEWQIHMVTVVTLTDRLRYLRSLTVAENKAAKPSLTLWKIGRLGSKIHHLWGKSMKIL